MSQKFYVLKALKTKAVKNYSKQQLLMHIILISSTCKNCYNSGMGVGRTFSRATAVKFHFTNSKLKETYFSTETLLGKYQISKSKGACPPAPPSDAHGFRIYKDVRFENVQLHSLHQRTFEVTNWIQSHQKQSWVVVMKIIKLWFNVFFPSNLFDLMVWLNLNTTCWTWLYFCLYEGVFQ